MAKPKSKPATIGERIRAARLRAGLTHEALAKASGLGLDTVIKLQTGSRQPGADTLAALCRALSVSADELLGL